MLLSGDAVDFMVRLGERVISNEIKLADIYKYRDEELDKMNSGKQVGTQQTVKRKPAAMKMEEPPEEMQPEEQHTKKKRRRKMRRRRL